MPKTNGPGTAILLDGPGEDLEFEVQRTPRFIRAVEDNVGNWRLLDLPEDEPDRMEEVFVYSLAYRNGDECQYTYIASIDVEKATLRYTKRWREWTRRHMHEER